MRDAVPENTLEAMREAVDVCTESYAEELEDVVKLLTRALEKKLEI